MKPGPSRKAKLPGASFHDSAFFDPTVQRVMERIATTNGDLAAVTAFESCEWLKVISSEGPEPTPFAVIYREDPVTISELLNAIARFDRTPVEQMTRARKIAAFTNYSSKGFPRRLLPWPEIAALMAKAGWDRNMVVENAPSDFHKEHRRRVKIVERWALALGEFKASTGVQPSWDELREWIR